MIYQYEICDTGEVVEVEQSIKDDPLNEIIIHGARFKVKRIISGGSGTVFKGDRWESKKGY